MHIALVTGSENPELYTDDLPLKSYLESRGVVTSVVIWNDSEIDWKKYHWVVIRSIWDYIKDIDVFSAWLDFLRSHHIKVLNPISVMEWNKQKHYLIELADQGILIPPTIHIKKNTKIDLQYEIDKVSWDKAVIKPTISVGAIRTWILTKENADTLQPDVDLLLSEQDIFIQKFAEEIKSQGEISVVYFNKKYSHAVLKRPKENDFRVQFQYGGTYEKYFPADSLLQSLETILSKIKAELLYARIDGYINREGLFCLMEIELIEPVLFVSSDQDAPQNFYTALLEIISG